MGCGARFDGKPVGCGARVDRKPVGCGARPAGCVPRDDGDVAGRVEVDLGGGTCAGEAAGVGVAAGLVTSRVLECAICTDAIEMALRSAAPGAALPVLLGVGRPLLEVLSFPQAPGLMNRLGGPGRGFGRRASIALATRMMSPAR